MTISQGDQEILVELLQELSPSELSTVLVSLKEPGSQIGTSTESNNYAFLMKLTELNLAKEVPLDLDIATVTSFSINDDAKADIARLLESVSDADK